MFDVACVGILVVDVIAKPVNKVPEKGQLGQVNSIEMYNGGNAMNAAINLSKMGFKTAMVGKVGYDAFGAFLEKALTEENVNTDSLVKDKNAQTSSSVVLSAADGERTFLHCVGTDGTFSIDDINWNIIEKSKFVFVTGSFLMGTFDGDQTRDF